MCKHLSLNFSEPFLFVLLSKFFILPLIVPILLVVNMEVYLQDSNAQIPQKQNLKTYYNPDFRFSVKYPDFEGKVNISEIKNPGPIEDLIKRLDNCKSEVSSCVLNTSMDLTKVHLYRVQFSGPNFEMEVNEKESYTDLKRNAIQDMILFENKLNDTILEDVQPVLYDMTFGYSFLSLSSSGSNDESGILIKSVYLDNKKYTYTIRIYIPNTQENLELIDKILDSFKIFR